jgi:hypothetical protein
MLWREHGTDYLCRDRPAKCTSMASIVIRVISESVY